ncbi:MAG: immune inhibitor A [Saprospiraceae bacterium]|nr:immune inhibitor A [Saprospiraceae bacterium]
MNRTLFLTITVGLITTALLRAQTPERYARVEISLVGKNVNDLAALGIEADHGQWLSGRSLVTELSESEIALVKNAGFQLTTLIPDLQTWLRERDKNAPVVSRNEFCPSGGAAYPTPLNYTYGTMAGYHTYAQMLDVLDDMAAKFPHLITVKKPISDTIVTWEGRPIWYVKISDNPNANEGEKQVLYTSLHHAREPNSASQMIFYMWYLLENYAYDPLIQYIVNNLELHFIPCVNPDGYVYNETTNPDGYGFWRKNRRNNGDGTFGVDLNRNYGYFWGNDNSGSSPITNSQTYRGPSPFSEPETRAMRDFCLEHDFLFAFNYHTFSNLLIYPWAYNDSPADSSLIKYAQLFTRENNYVYGTTGQTVGYPVNGSSDDWMYAQAGALSYTPEVGKTGFWPSFGEIDNLNRENVWPNLSMALCALRFADISDLNETFVYPTTSQMSFGIRRYGMEDGPFTVKLEPLSAGITSPSATQVFDLQVFESANFNFPVAFASNVPTGAELLFLLETSSGNFVKKDTLRKIFIANSNNLALLYENSCDDFLGWLGTFDITTETFVSPPASFTDSPNAPYSPNSIAVHYFEDAVLIPDSVIFAQLRFFARWDIEPRFDYAQVIALDEAFEATPLCGIYSKAGAGPPQPDNEPIYDGLQFDWVEERINLSDFVGKPIRIGFILQSNGFIEGDGFYFDDVRIEYLSASSSTPIVQALLDFQVMQNQPNPTSGVTLIRWETREQNVSDEALLLAFNVLGEKMYERTVNLKHENHVRLDTRTWPPGLYTYLLRTADGQTQPFKMTVVR